MQIYNLHVNAKVNNSRNSGVPRVKAHLITTLVPNQDDERPVICLDAIIDQRGDARVELLSHVALHQAQETEGASAGRFGGGKQKKK